jgi:hypothetical protein
VCGNTRKSEEASPDGFSVAAMILDWVNVLLIALAFNGEIFKYCMTYLVIGKSIIFKSHVDLFLSQGARLPAHKMSDPLGPNEIWHHNKNRTLWYLNLTK